MFCGHIVGYCIIQYYFCDEHYISFYVGTAKSTSQLSQYIIRYKKYVPIWQYCLHKKFCCLIRRYSRAVGILLLGAQ